MASTPNALGVWAEYPPFPMGSRTICKQIRMSKLNGAPGICQTEGQATGHWKTQRRICKSCLKAQIPPELMVHFHVCFSLRNVTGHDYGFIHVTEVLFSSWSAAQERLGMLLKQLLEPSRQMMSLKGGSQWLGVARVAGGQNTACVWG